jgi:hypothetical protein
MSIYPKKTTVVFLIIPHPYETQEALSEADDYDGQHVYAALFWLFPQKEKDANIPLYQN